MDQKTINIQCEGSTTVTLDELKELHHYKDLTKEAYEKAKNSILRLGFSFPIFFWEDKDATKYIIDAHQRKRVLMQMRADEGYLIPPLPAVRVFAKDKKQAKEKIMAQESHYGKIQEPELYEFINEEGFELNEEELAGFTEIYEFNMEYKEEPEKTDEDTPKKEQCKQCNDYHKANHITISLSE